MSKPRAKAVKSGVAPRRSGGGFPWGLVLIVMAGVAGVVAFNAARSKPAAPPVATWPTGDYSFLPTAQNKTPAPAPVPAVISWIPGGEFSIRSTVDGA